MEERLDSPERLMQYAAEGRLTKHSLATLLTAEPRRVFLEACATIEMKYTTDCTATNDPCLESGCAVEGEVCLQPLLNAGTEYHRAYGAKWAALFADPANRVSAWNIDMSTVGPA
jgi:hypothetical protein